jgi:hypothetical protein
MLDTAFTQSESITSIDNVKNETPTGSYRLVGLEASNLHNGAEIPVKVWEPLFGNELREVWNKVLVNSGDEVIIKGSSVLKLVFGGYLLDEVTGHVDPRYRSDIDIFTYQPDVESRINSATLGNIRQKFVSKEINVSGAKAEFVSINDIRRLDLQALDELHKWMVGQHEKLENNHSFAMLLNDLRYGRSLLAEATPVQVLLCDNFLPTESICLKLNRNQSGELSMTLIDGAEFLDEENMYTQIQLSHYKHEDAYSGLMVRNPYMASVHTYFLEAMCYMGGDVEFSSKTPLWSIDEINRVMKSACIGDLTLGADPAINPNPFFNELHYVASRLSKGGDNIFHMKKGLKFSSSDGGDLEVGEWFKKKFQKAFAESAYFNPTYAYYMAFLSLPMGNFISEDFGNFFDSYHKTIPPNTVLPEYLDQLSRHGFDDADGAFQIPSPVRAALLKTLNGQTPQESTHPCIVSIRSYASMLYLCDLNFGFKEIPYNSLSGEVNHPHTFVDMNRYPKNMSEIMALMLVSMRWNLDKDDEKIQNIVSNWEVKGPLEGTWIRDSNAQSAFDKGLDLELIKQYMRNLKSTGLLESQ